MALTIGELVGFIRADDTGMRRGLSDAELRMRGFQRDTEGRLRRLNGTFATLGEQAELGFRQAGDGADRFGLSLGRLIGVGRGLAGVAASIGMIAAKLGAVVPVAAGLAATLANIAPAAGLAATGIVAVVLASKALQLGMVGVGDAVKAAMDPSNPEAFNEALKKLSPSAQAFAKEVRALQPEFKKLQQDVQERLFKGLDNTLKGLAKNTLPTLRQGLLGASEALNRMGKNIGVAANNLSTSGALGMAMSGATAGLKNLSRIPGQFVQGLGQIAAAAAPAFQRLTGMAAGAMDRLSGRLSAAFESGAMRQAIENAISLIGQLVDIAKDVGSIFNSVFSAAQVSGGGMLGVLKEITGSMRQAFASPEVQGGLRAIFQTMSLVAKTAAPLFGQALRIVGQVLQAIAPGVQNLVRTLGPVIQRVLSSLGPVLVKVADTFGKLLIAASPLVALFGDVLAAVLPSLTPLFDALGKNIAAATPFVQQMAGILSKVLVGAFSGLSKILVAMAPHMSLLAQKLFPVLTEALVLISPSVDDLVAAFLEVVDAVVPLLPLFTDLVSKLLDELLPAITPLIIGFALLTAKGLTLFANILENVVVPAIQILVDLLQGDFASALGRAQELSNRVKTYIGQKFLELRDKVVSYLNGLAGRAVAAFQGMMNNLSTAASRKLGEIVGWFRALPGRIAGAVGNLGGLLYSAGRAVVQGLINGVNSALGSLRATLSDVTGMIPDWKGPPEKDARLLTPAGRSVIQGFQAGIAAQVPSLQRQLQGITGAMPGMAMGPLYGGRAGGGAPQRIVIELQGPAAMRDLIRGIVQVDGRGSAEVAFSQR